jgi:hypothetical protein
MTPPVVQQWPRHRIYHWKPFIVKKLEPVRAPCHLRREHRRQAMRRERAKASKRVLVAPEADFARFQLTFKAMLKSRQFK